MTHGLPVSSEALETASLAIGFGGMVPYVVSILRGKTKPHIFTWLTWGLVQSVIFTAQSVSEAGPARWTTALGAVSCFGVVALGLVRGEKHVTRSDWVTFILAMVTIPVWYLTHDPLYSVLLGTFIDGLGYYPTFRKSWAKPYQESLLSYVVFTIAWGISLAAFDTYSWTTATYALFSTAANLVLIATLIGRRATMKNRGVIRPYTHSPKTDPSSRRTGVGEAPE